MYAPGINLIRGIGTALLVGAVVGSCCSMGRAEVLVDDTWTDGSRAETDLPTEAAVWVGRPDDVAVKPGALSTKMGGSSQKIWCYFTDSEPVTVKVGQTLTASISFIPRGALTAHTSRNFRVGLFHDPTDARVTSDTNADSGGNGDPWTDATGYAVQVLLTNDEYVSTAPFDLGKRTDTTAASLLGTSGAYTKYSSGPPTAVALDQEYTVSLALKRVSDTHMDVTATLSQGDETLAKATERDDGSGLGSQPVFEQFDQLFIRLSDGATTADQIDFTRFKVTLEP